MPRFATRLLMRDKRLGAFEAEGLTVKWHRMEDVEFREALLGKLLEESHEVVDAVHEGEKPETLKELADVLEVLRTLAELEGFTWADVQAMCDKRANKLGRFEGRVFSEWLEATEGSESAEYHRKYPEKYPEMKDK
jgi:predicted house-cleaning noncanonical NTP pyrophosphatase (MazG superfamily)